VAVLAFRTYLKCTIMPLHLRLVDGCLWRMKIVDCIQEFASIFGGFTRFSSLFHYPEERRALLVLLHLTSQQGRWHFNKRDLLAHRS
jgi:hypothetical protein